MSLIVGRGKRKRRGRVWELCDLVFGIEEEGWGRVAKSTK